MKNLFLSLIFILSFFSFSSCSDETIKLEDNQNIQIEKKSLPLPVDDSLFITEWEKYDDIHLTSGKYVKTPWYPTSTGNFPREVASDIKQEDGWILIHNDNYDIGSDYLSFYNRYTGVLKIFYYQESDNPNTGLVWEIHDPSKKGYLQQGAFLTDPIDYEKTEKKIVSGLRADSETGLSKGWNVFQVALTYTPDQEEHNYIDIFGQTLDYSSIDFSALLEGSIKGSILEINEDAGVKDKKVTTFIAKKSGNAVDGWLKKEAEKWAEKESESKGIFGKLTKSAIDLIKTKGSQGLIEKGVSILLGSFLGKDATATKPMNFTVELNTNSKLTGTGTIKKIQDGTINSLKLDINKFGVWNLETAPTIRVGYTKTEVYHMSRNNRTDLGAYETYSYSNPKYKVVVNPDILNEVDIETSAHFVVGLPYKYIESYLDYYKIIPAVYFNWSNLFNSYSVNKYFMSDPIVLDSAEIASTNGNWSEVIGISSPNYLVNPLSYQDFHAYTSALMYNPKYTPELKLTYTPTSNSSASHEFGDKRTRAIYPVKNIVVAITVTLTVKKTGQKIISTRTFFPNYIFNW